MELVSPETVLGPKGEEGVFGVFGVRSDLISGVGIITHHVINLGSYGVKPITPQLYALLWQCNRQVFDIWMIEPYSHNKGQCGVIGVSLFRSNGLRYLLFLLTLISQAYIVCE